MYLVVDSKNPDFQLVHVDALNGWGLALQFNFINDTEFEILAAKHIIANRSGTIEYPLKKIQKTDPDDNRNSDRYKYKLKIEIFLTKPTSSSTFNVKIENIEYTKKKSSQSESPRIEHLIDVHISNNPYKTNLTEKTLESTDGPIVDFGTEFCRFYVV